MNVKNFVFSQASLSMVSQQIASMSDEQIHAQSAAFWNEDESTEEVDESTEQPAQPQEEVVA